MNSTSLLQVISADLDADRNIIFGKGNEMNLTSSAKSKFMMDKNGVAAALETWQQASIVQDERSRKRRSLVSHSQTQKMSEHQINIKSTEMRSEDTKTVRAFEKSYYLLSLFAKCFGIKLTYGWVPQRHIKWLFTMCLIIFTWFCIFYTQYTHIKSGNILRVLEACAIYGIASSCTQKLLGHLEKRNRMLALFFSIRSICLRNLSGSRADVLQSQLRKTLAFLKLYVVGVALCVCFFLACPIKAYIDERKLESLLPLEIVFVDQSTYLGFGIANFTMVLMGFFAGLGTIIYGNAFIFCILNYSMLVELIGEDFKDLDRMWIGTSIIPTAYKKAYLTNICKKRQDLMNYMNQVKYIFETKFFFYFCFNYFSQIICLFEVTKNDWTPGLPIAFTLFIEMMFYCKMGTEITIANERLCSMIYATNWYTYDLQSQRMILVLLRECQDSKALRLGPLGPLNVVTGTQIVKSICSYYTALKKIV